MNKTEIIAELRKQGIKFDESATKAELLKLLPETTPAAGNKQDEDEQDIQVNDVHILKPVELPLVVVLPKDASKAQIAYAQTLNGYAYKNPKKWAIKKNGLIAKLRDLKNAPDPVEDEGPKLSLSRKLPA